MWLGYPKMDGYGSAPLAQEMKQHKRLLHAIGSDHTDPLGQEATDKKQEAVGLQRRKYRGDSLRSKQGDKGRQREHSLQNRESHQQARARYQQPQLRQAERRDLPVNTPQPFQHICFLSLREEAVPRRGPDTSALCRDLSKRLT